MTFDQWDVIAVPFPFTEKPGSKRRPALVLSKAGFHRSGHSILAMITSAAHTPWPGDVKIANQHSAGLKAPCVVRLKIFTLDNRLTLYRIGRLSAGDRESVLEIIHKFLV